MVLIGLQIALIAFGLASGAPWEVWASGVFFGAMSGFGTLVGADLERRNRLLVEAQGEVRLLAASAERERIAQDLHDLLGHTLTLVAVKADLAARLAEAEPSAARREMQEVAAAAREALAEVRSAVTGMKGASLAHEVERARTMLAAANLKTRIAVDAAALDPRREAVLAMALREAVTNVIRHAQATSCTIAVDLDPDGAMRLVVADDGRGGRILEGSGLLGMRARLSAAGGVLAVESGKEGTTLAARLPELAA
jgi:two-component system sensor histidine kinase DesK